MGMEVAKGALRVETGAGPTADVGFQPTALVLWWSREVEGGCTGGMGFAAADGSAASTAWAADDALAPGVLSRQGSEAPLLFHHDPRAPDRSCRGHLRLTDNGFSVHLDGQPEGPWRVHYLAVGGSDVDAAVRSFTLDGTGRRSVSGLGFTPGIVLAAAGAGSAAGEPQPGLAFGFGAASRPSEQVACGVASRVDDRKTVARGAQCIDAVVALPAAAEKGEMAALSRLVSFDQDGVTLETTHLTSELPVAVLTLAGAEFAVGLGTASSRTTPVGIELAGAILFGTGLNAMPHARDIGRLCVGGFSREQRAGCASWSIRRRGAWPPEPRSRFSAEAAFEVVDTTSGELHAQATLAGLGRGRFSLSWPVRDRAPRDFGYAAFGPAVAKPTLRDRLRLPGRSRPLRK